MGIECWIDFLRRREKKKSRRRNKAFPNDYLFTYIYVYNMYII